MIDKRRARSVLTKAEILEACRTLRLKITQRMKLDELVDHVARSERAPLDKLLPLLSKDALERVCLTLEMPVEVRTKQAMIDSLLRALIGTQLPLSSGAEPAPPLTTPSPGATQGPAAAALSAGDYRVAARVTDVFGNDGIATAEVRVR